MRNFESSNPFSRTCVSKLLRCEKLSHASTSRVHTHRTAKGQLITAGISVQTLIFHLVVNSTRPKTVRSALWRCPNSTVALRLLENVVKVTNLPTEALR